MIKKLFFLVLISFLVISCGKRGDPTYEEPKSEIPYVSTKNFV